MLYGTRWIYYLMKFLSWNVNSLGRRNKRDLVKEVLIRGCSDVIFFRSIWEFRDKDRVVLLFLGVFGGIFIVWDIIFCLGFFSISVFLRIRGIYKCWVISMYGSIFFSRRYVFWLDYFFYNR